MIRGFKSRATERLWMGETVRQFRAIEKQALRKLDALNAAKSLADLRAAPGNRLEALKGDRKGQHAVRINDQWRLCFEWTDKGPDRVEIVDYH
jgi:proteic killer suppression protein